MMNSLDTGVLKHALSDRGKITFMAAWLELCRFFLFRLIICIRMRSSIRARAARQIVHQHERPTSLSRPTSTRNTTQFPPSPFPPAFTSTRQASTSSLLTPFSTFFSRRPPSHKPLSSAREEFLAASADRQIGKLKTAYESLCDSPGPFPLTSSEYAIAMDACSRSASPHALDLLRRMYLDMPLHNLPQQAKHHAAMVRGLASADRPKEAFDLAVRVDDGPNGGSIEWIRILTAAVRCEMQDLVPAVAQVMREKSQLDKHAYVWLLRHIRFSLNSSNDPISADEGREQLRAILAEHSERGKGKGGIGREGEAEIVMINVAFGDEEGIAKAEEKVSSWKNSKLPMLGQQWNALADLLIAKDDIVGLEGLLREIGPMADMEPPHKAVEYVAIAYLKSRVESKSDVSTIDVVKAVEAAEEISERQAPSPVWAEVLRYLIRNVPNSLATAYHAYGVARDRGIATDMALARALVHPLCTANPPHLDEAITVYNDLVPSLASLSRTRAQSVAIYQSLLLACSRKASPQANATALRLLTDMREQHLAFTSGVLTSLVILLIKASPDHRTAFNLYAHFYALNRSAFDESSYMAIITAYLNFSTDQSPFPPPKLYMEIIKDMYRAGYRPKSQIVTSLLSLYGAQARTSRKSSSDESFRARKIESLYKVISELHTMMKLDPLVEIDTPLLTALMDGYGRVEAYADAFEVWSELVERRSRESPDRVKELYSPSINVMLDTCGHAQLLGRARKAWTWAGRWGLREDRRNWNAWVECLCRCGQMDEAFETVLQMKHGKADRGVEVGKDTVAILLKFSWLSSQTYETVKRRVQEEFPEWWEELRGLVETSRHRKRDEVDSLVE